MTTRKARGKLKDIKAALEQGAGMLKVAAEFGVGSSTVQKIRKRWSRRARSSRRSRG